VTRPPHVTRSVRRVRRVCARPHCLQLGRTFENSQRLRGPRRAPFRPHISATPRDQTDTTQLLSPAVSTAFVVVLLFGCWRRGHLTTHGVGIETGEVDQSKFSTFAKQAQTHECLTTAQFAATFTTLRSSRASCSHSAKGSIREATAPAPDSHALRQPCVALSKDLRRTRVCSRWVTARSPSCQGRHPQLILTQAPGTVLLL